MKTLISALLVIISFSAKAQMDTTNSHNLRLAGIELSKSASLQEAGWGFMIGGGIIVGISQSNGSDNMKGIGYGIAALGGVLEIIGLSHQNSASVYMQGNSLVVPFGR